MHHRIATWTAGDPACLLGRSAWLFNRLGRKAVGYETHLALLLWDDASQLLPLGQLLAQDVGRILVPCLDGLPHRVQLSGVCNSNSTTARSQQRANMVSNWANQGGKLLGQVSPSQKGRLRSR